MIARGGIFQKMSYHSTSPSLLRIQLPLGVSQARGMKGRSSLASERNRSGGEGDTNESGPRILRIYCVQTSCCFIYTALCKVILITETYRGRIWDSQEPRNGLWQYWTQFFPVTSSVWDPAHGHPGGSNLSQGKNQAWQSQLWAWLRRKGVWQQPEGKWRTLQSLGSHWNHCSVPDTTQIPLQASLRLQVMSADKVSRYGSLSPPVPGETCTSVCTCLEGWCSESTYLRGPDSLGLNVCQEHPGCVCHVWLPQARLISSDITGYYIWPDTH